MTLLTYGSPAVRQADTAARLELIGFSLTVGYLAFLAGAVLQGHWLLEADGKPFANNFVNRWLGGSMTMAWVAQAVLIAAVATAVVKIWRSKTCFELKAAALAAGALLATPYLYIYDLPVLAVPMAFLLQLGLREGFRSWEAAGPAMAGLLILAYPMIVAPTGWLATLIVAALIGRRVVARSVVPTLNLPRSLGSLRNSRPSNKPAAAQTLHRSIAQ